MLKIKSITCRTYAIPCATGLATVAMSFPAFATEPGTSSGSLTDTLKIFSEVMAWFLKEGGTLLSWMLDKPIILLSLAIFFVGSVIGVLSRIYSSF